ncbi:hypothetical protein ACU635_25835 [[Actinomadura] parvosata]|uniref:hypothetical protein n=1 Tax=[Actinomadura] parvosata TaxID=1955412 RepID=UPI00406D0FB2
MAAHYLARPQPTPELTLHWNQECLNRANLVRHAVRAGLKGLALILPAYLTGLGLLPG